MINTDMETWMHDFCDERIFRVWRYKKMFIPLEQDRKYIDQSIYENDECKYMWIEEVVEIPNGRILFGFKDVESALMRDHGDISFEPPIEYMLDGEFTMECYEHDLSKLSKELGYYDEEEDESEQ